MSDHLKLSSFKNVAEIIAFFLATTSYKTGVSVIIKLQTLWGCWVPYDMYEVRMYMYV